MDAAMNSYEGMFLLDSPAGDMNQAVHPVRNVLDRIEATVLSIKPWDERRLAYEVKGRKRGLYVLTYFQSPPGKIAELEHDCQLNELILRVLIRRREAITEEMLAAETPASLGAARAAAGEAEAAGRAGAEAVEAEDEADISDVDLEAEADAE
jgi:small subunit ribosomal protein S6